VLGSLKEGLRLSALILSPSVQGLVHSSAATLKTPAKEDRRQHQHELRVEGQTLPVVVQVHQTGKPGPAATMSIPSVRFIAQSPRKGRARSPG